MLEVYLACWEQKSTRLYLLRVFVLGLMFHWHVFCNFGVSWCIYLMIQWPIPRDWLETCTLALLSAGLRAEELLYIVHQLGMTNKNRSDEVWGVGWLVGLQFGLVWCPCCFLKRWSDMTFDMMWDRPWPQSQADMECTAYNGKDRSETMTLEECLHSARRPGVFGYFRMLRTSQVAKRLGNHRPQCSQRVWPQRHLSRFGLAKINAAKDVTPQEVYQKGSPKKSQKKPDLFLVDIHQTTINQQNETASIRL